ncbi:hypothetical protein HAX54_052393 [Datura stramonium]|uniref:Uncharacterized protein n=1 Tax=Datura stramonium TaxID=4076 RepID=A0ABS8WQM4_DATST|nr:hypothetical protein [Datura stramonium]
MFSRQDLRFFLSSDDNDDDNNPISNSIECYVCTQVGVSFSTPPVATELTSRREASAGSSLIPIQNRLIREPKNPVQPQRAYVGAVRACVGPSGSKRVQRWKLNHLVGIVAWLLAADPLFFTPYPSAVVDRLAFSIGVCIERVAGGWVWETRLGCACDCFTMFGCILAGGSKTNKRRADKAYNDDPSTNVPVPIPPQSLSQHKLDEKDAKRTVGDPCAGNSTNVIRKPMCLDVNGPFPYGIYQWALPVVSSRSITVKILYPIFWGLMTLGKLLDSY